MTVAIIVAIAFYFLLFILGCGEEININPIVQVQNPLFEIKQIYPLGGMPIDLCENCSKKFVEWVKDGERKDGKNI